VEKGAACPTAKGVEDPPVVLGSVVGVAAVTVEEDDVWGDVESPAHSPKANPPPIKPTAAATASPVIHLDERETEDKGEAIIKLLSNN
jgi:hypothetical protein